MTVWNEVSHFASGFAQGIEDAAQGAAHELSREAHAAYDGLKVVGHQAELLGEGVVTGAIFNPINGVEQIVNSVAGTHLPALEFTNQEEVNHSIAGKIGMVAGTIVDFVVTDGAAGALMGVEAGSVASLAVAGAIQGGILSPSDSNKTGGAFLLDRIENAAIDAGTFAVMGGVAGKLGAFAQPAAPLGTRMLQAAIANGAGGGAGGLVTAEGTAILKEGRLASVDEVASSVFTGTAFGAGFGAGTVALEAGVQAWKGPLKAGDDVRPRLNRGYDNPDQVAAQIDVKSEVSQKFINQVADTMDNLPDDTRRFITDENLRVRVAKQVTDLDPSMKGQRPGGWDSGTWDNAEGYYWRNDGAVVSEYLENDQGAMVKSDRIPGVTRHEIGHGVDDMLQRYSTNLKQFSGNPEFEAAWNADWMAMPQNTAIHDMWYYIQADKPGRGPSEAFADLFAAVNGGAANQSQTEAILSHFPRTTKVIQDILNNLPLPKGPPRNYAK